MYFSSFPQIQYTINEKTENVLDIFRRVAISNTTSNELYDIIVVTDSDTLETLAEKYYGDSNLSWVIAITNNMINPNEEFVKSSAVMAYLQTTIYKGDIFYFELKPNLQQGDILISVNSNVPPNTRPENLSLSNLNTSKYCFVNSYDETFRYARVTNMNGTFSVSDKFAAYRKIKNQLELITFPRKISNTSSTITACVLQLVKKDSYLNAPLYFYKTDDNTILSPYQKHNSVELVTPYDFINSDAYGLYFAANDTNAFKQSILYWILMDGNSLPNVSYATLRQDITVKNEKYRRIKILKNGLLASFLDTFSGLMSSTNINSRFISTKD